MGRKGHGPELISEILRKSAEGMPTAEICRIYGITERTFYRWKLRNSLLKPDDSRLLKQVEEENQQLKTLVAELILENRTLKGEITRSKDAGRVRPPSGARVQ
jgi:putative transposase